MHASPQEPIWDDEVVSLAVEVLRVLADPTRLHLAGLLLDDERSVSDLAALLDKPVPGVSQHLARMRMARLVTTRKQGTSVLYRVENGHVRQLVIDTIGHVEHLLDTVPTHHRAQERTAQAPA
ncbi:ArsR/SmtB family transcription factor [Calidifontibacter terrae]